MKKERYDRQQKTNLIIFRSNRLRFNDLSCFLMNDELKIQNICPPTIVLYVLSFAHVHTAQRLGQTRYVDITVDDTLFTYDKICAF